MAYYTVHDYHKDWATAKKNIPNEGKLFTKKLGPQLDTLNKLYTQFMNAGPKNFDAAAKKHSDLAIKIQNIVKDYRTLVNNNGKNAAALKVLTSIDGTGKGHMIFDMALDKGSRRQALHL